MVKLIDEFRRGWQGISRPSPLFSIGFAALLSCAGDRGALGAFPDAAGCIFHAVFSGRLFRHRVRRPAGRDPDGARRRRTRRIVNFSDAPPESARLGLLIIYLMVCGLTIWGIEHFRSIAAQQRRDLKAPDPGRGLSQARGRRASAPAEEQSVDRPRGSAPGVCATSRRSGPASISGYGRCRRPTT